MGRRATYKEESFRPGLGEMARSASLILDTKEP